MPRIAMGREAGLIKDPGQLFAFIVPGNFPFFLLFFCSKNRKNVVIWSEGGF